MIPNSQHRLIVGNKIDPVWLRFLQSLDGKANASDITAIATALGSPDGTVANIPDQSADDLRILQAAGIAVTRGEGGEYYIALRPLGDSGAGTFKLITRDTTGRISGSEDGTAADVPYDNTASGLAAEDVQAAVDELQAEKLGDAPSDGTTYGRKDGAWVGVGGSGGSINYATASVGVKSTSDTTIPYDDTIPQITEGVEITELAVTITPTSAGSKLLVRLTLPAVAASANGTGVRFAIFRDSTADAIAAASPVIPDQWTWPLVLEVVVPSNAATATTFTVRWAVSAGTGYINRARGTAGLFGAASIATMLVQEL